MFLLVICSVVGSPSFLQASLLQFLVSPQTVGCDFVLGKEEYVILYPSTPTLTVNTALEDVDSVSRHKFGLFLVNLKESIIHHHYESFYTISRHIRAFQVLQGNTWEHLFPVCVFADDICR